MSWFSRSPQIEAQNALLTALLADSTARHTADAALATKRAEIELRKEELNLQYAETLAKAKATEREEAYKLRQLKKEAGGRGGLTTQARKHAQAEQPNCKVCAGEINLIPADIYFHTTGHQSVNPPDYWN